MSLAVWQVEDEAPTPVSPLVVAASLVGIGAAAGAGGAVLASRALRRD